MLSHWESNQRLSTLPTAEELRLMHQSGMIPMEIIVVATKSGALVCNLEDEIRTMEKEKIADILVGHSDPFSDLPV